MDSFALFPRLITELRCLIWKFALLQPRLVLIYKHNPRTATTRTHVRRSVTTPLLSVSQESRLEALKYYFPRSLLPNTDHNKTLFPLSLTPSIKTPSPIGPGTDIIYISGHGLPPSRRTPETWTLTHLLNDLDSPSPSFSPIRNLAIDLSLLLTTPFSITPKLHIPYGIWKLIICDLHHLQTLIVIPTSSCSDPQCSVPQIKAKLEIAKTRFLDFWEEMMGFGDESEGEEGGAGEEVGRLRSWKMPVVEVRALEDVVGSCWV